MTIEKILDDCANTIRQQAQEIAMLKQIIDANNLSQNIGQFVKPIDEPVAWMFRGYLYDVDPSDWAVHEHPNVPVIPLYKHSIRELTDEEINKLWAESHEDGIAMQQRFTTQQHYFAHLILRKASEK